MLRSVPLLLSLSLVLIGSGCSVRSLVNRINKESEKTSDIICDECSDLFPDTLECKELYASMLVDDDDCTIEALELDDGSRETLACSLDVLKDYNRCLEDELDCNVPTSFEGCQQIFTDADCPDLPIEVQLALNACN